MQSAHAAFRHRDFRLYFASYVAANLGAEMLGVAVGWQVYSITHRALDLGFVGLAQFLPAFALSLPAGNLADRVDRGRVVAVCGSARRLRARAGVAGRRRLRARHADLRRALFVGVARAFVGAGGRHSSPASCRPSNSPTR